jgi:hypothetical protein
MARTQAVDSSELAAWIGCVIKRWVTQDGTVFDVVDMERQYVDYDRWRTTLAEASARLDTLKPP